MKRILVIVAWAYNPYEFWKTLKAIKHEGWGWEVLSTKEIIEEEQTRRERFKVRHIDTFEIKEVKFYDGLIFVSGNPIATAKYYYHERAQAILKEFDRQEKPIAAMCLGVPIIRKVLKGRKATWFPVPQTTPLMEQAGVMFANKSIVVDGRYVTIYDQEGIENLMEAFVNLVKAQPSRS